MEPLLKLGATGVTLVFEEPFVTLVAFFVNGYIGFQLDLAGFIQTICTHVANRNTYLLVGWEPMCAR